MNDSSPEIFTGRTSLILAFTCSRRFYRENHFCSKFASRLTEKNPHFKPLITSVYFLLEHLSSCYQLMLPLNLTLIQFSAKKQPRALKHHRSLTDQLRQSFLPFILIWVRRALSHRCSVEAEDSSKIRLLTIFCVIYAGAEKCEVRQQEGKRQEGKKETSRKRIKTHQRNATENGREFNTQFSISLMWALFSTNVDLGEFSSLSARCKRLQRRGGGGEREREEAKNSRRERKRRGICPAWLAPLSAY